MSEPTPAVSAAEAEQKPKGPTFTATRRTAMLGAMFLMAVSAVGPGFITQTSEFTMQLGAAFAAAILISVIVDVAIQMNVWRTLGVSGLYAQELGNRILPGLGWALAALIFFGGIVFNVGNIAGAGLGMQAMSGLDPQIGGAVSVLIAMAIFLSKRAGVALDRIVIVCGAVLILLMGYMAIVTSPPVGEAAIQTFAPTLPEGEGLSTFFFVTTTLIGGTVGGYITYAGAHRVIASGHTGPENASTIARTSVMGIIVASVIRYLLFLSILGVVTAYSVTQIEETGQDNVAASAFLLVLGEWGLRVFGVAFWVAAITSILGATYTSVSFITTQKTSPRVRAGMLIGFLVLTCGIYLTLGQAPATLLIMAGAFNGAVLPLGFAVILIAAWFRRETLLGGYKYPKWLLISGTLIWLLTIYMGANSLTGIADLWTQG
ncbi:NRAMP family divalent metal transporter [Nesterenkonia populi]|uniref:NRAMP family divalent metal transporter n=1 Tax=Nesterenkonia populi TaxID=1591087 RepID=UPI003CCC5539